MFRIARCAIGETRCHRKINSETASTHPLAIFRLRIHARIAGTGAMCPIIDNNKAYNPNRSFALGCWLAKVKNDKF